MKSLNAKFFTIAATLAIAATTASAQVTLKASVPFSFTAGSQVMPAGEYRIPVSGGPAWRITNDDNGQTVMGLGNHTAGSMKEHAALVFECREKGCSLRKIQAGGGTPGYELPAPKRSKSDADELARVVIVPLSNSD